MPPKVHQQRIGGKVGLNHPGSRSYAEGNDTYGTILERYVEGNGEKSRKLYWLKLIPMRNSALGELPVYSAVKVVASSVIILTSLLFQSSASVEDCAK